VTKAPQHRVVAKFVLVVLVVVGVMMCSFLHGSLHGRIRDFGLPMLSKTGARP
jgi:hypothetical protein